MRSTSPSSRERFERVRGSTTREEEEKVRLINARDVEFHGTGLIPSYQQNISSQGEESVHSPITSTNDGDGTLIFEKNLLFGYQHGYRRYVLFFLSVLLFFFGVGLISSSSSSTRAQSEIIPSSLMGSTNIASNLTLRWGIAGLGRISDDFAVALFIAGANITAVAAGALPHTKSRALAFGAKFGVPKSRCYGTYEELAADPNVDVVYIGNTNQLHYKTALLMIDRSKHVLLEKPTAMTVQETKRMISAAKAKGVLFTTNFWTRYFPAIKYVKEQMSSGCIGDIVGIRGDFGFQAKADPNDRYFNAEAGGGALLDMGCYLIQFATLAHQSVLTYKDYLRSIASTTHSPTNSEYSNYFDNSKTQTKFPYEYTSMFPDEIEANGLVGSDGVDVETAFLLRWKSQSLSRSLQETSRQLVTPYGVDMIQSRSTDQYNFKGLTGIFSTSLRRGSPFSVEIMGTHGFINIHDPANCPSSCAVNVGTDAYSSTTGEFQFPVKPLCAKNNIGANLFSEPIPIRPAQFGAQYYPGTTGFVYVIRAVDHCITGKGEYHSSRRLRKMETGDDEFRCLEMPELSSEEQILIMEIIESIQKDTHP